MARRFLRSTLAPEAVRGSRESLLTSAAPSAPPSGGLAGLAAGLGGGGGLGGILSQVLGQTAGGKKPLADALAPYLSADRARRLSRALRIGAAARIALAAFSEWGRGDGV